MSWVETLSSGAGNFHPLIFVGGLGACVPTNIFIWGWGWGANVLTNEFYQWVGGLCPILGFVKLKC